MVRLSASALFPLMDDLDAPPSYEPRPSASESPPAYIFPATLTIGSHRINDPLVNTAQLKGHLSLLGAFYTLRVRVESIGGDSSGNDNLGADKFPTLFDKVTAEARERRWALFVGLAVERCVTSK